MKWFKRHTCPPPEIKTVHVPCVPSTVTLHHTYGERPYPKYGYVETRTEEGLPLRSAPFQVTEHGIAYVEILIPTSGGGFTKHGVQIRFQRD